MFKKRNLLVRSGFCALLLALTAAESRSATAQPTPGLPGAAAITAAARADSAADMNLALVQAIAANPRRVDDLVAFATAQAPSHRDSMVSAASAAFPAFAPRIRSAAMGTGGSGAGAAPVTATASAPGQVAAVNAAALPTAAAADKGKWSGEIDVGGSRATGNTESEQVNAALRVGYQSGPWDSTANVSYDFAKDSGEINTQRLRVGGNTKYRFTDRFFAYGLIDYDDDRFSGFNYELTQSGGLGYRPIHTDDWEVEVSAGPALRISERKDTGEQDVEPGVRGDLRIAWNITEDSSLTNTSSVTWGQERMMMENTTALTMKVIGQLSGRLSYNIRHNTDVPQGTEGTDTLTKASLVYAF